MYNKHKMDKKQKPTKSYADQMFKRSEIYTEKSKIIVRLTSLLAPLTLVIYGVLIRFNFITIAHPQPLSSIGNWDLYVISFLLLCVGTAQVIFPIMSKAGTGAQLIAFHVLIGAYLVLITGIASPFMVFWILLTMESFTYFSDLGTRLSIGIFLATILSDIFIFHPGDTGIATFDVVALIIISYIMSIVVSTAKPYESARLDLSDAKVKETLQRDQVITIINNLSDAVLSTDMEGMIRVYNAASLNLLDTNKSLSGHFIDEVLPLTDQSGRKINLFKEFQNLKTVVKRDDLNFSFADGETIRLETTFSPIRNTFDRSKNIKTHDGYIIICRDITKAKSLEEERDEFVSVASHELRTPITIAEGTISNAQAMIDHPNVTTAMLKDSINSAHDQVMFLANLVNDLSTLSRAERDTEDNIEDIDVKELAHKLINKYKDETKAKKLHLDLDLAPKLGIVNVNRLYLEEILENIITNAIKYTKTGKITIIISQKNDKITFAIKDTGIGISKSDQSKIFSKFYRSEDYRTRETGGTGLGLYIAAKLAQKMGTKIQMVSRLNIGSTFSFTLKEKKEEK